MFCLLEIKYYIYIHFFSITCCSKITKSKKKYKNYVDIKINKNDKKKLIQNINKTFSCISIILK